MTADDLLAAIAGGYTAATGVVTASHAAPAEMTATPAVILTPADPWLVANRKLGACPEVRWTVQVVGGRFDLRASLDELAAGYLGALAALHAAGVGMIGPLERVDPTDIAGVPMIAATFSVTLPLDLGGP